MVVMIFVLLSDLATYISRMLSMHLHLSLCPGPQVGEMEQAEGGGLTTNIGDREGTV